MGQNKEYYAFISYKREDEKWAKWLQNKLEHYKFPTNLNGRTDLPKNIRPTFRDVTDLTPGFLAEEIDKALRSSEWLIVICSPRSAKSPWVCKEAQTFVDLGRADKIIPFVIEGNPFSKDSSTECYPEALLNLTDGRELLAANINEMGRDAAAIKVVARMFNLRFDTLWQRFKREKNRKLLVLGVIVVLLLLISLFVSIHFYNLNQVITQQSDKLANQYNEILEKNDEITKQNNDITQKNTEITKQYEKIKELNKDISEKNIMILRDRDKLLISQSKYLAAEAKREYNDGNLTKAIRLALYALPKDLESLDRPFVPEAENILRTSDLLESKDYFCKTVLSHSSNDDINSLAISSDGKYIITASDDETLCFWDQTNGKLIDVKEINCGNIESLIISPNERFVATKSILGAIHIFNINTLKEILNFQKYIGLYNYISFSPDSRYIVTALNDTTAKVLEIESGNTIIEHLKHKGTIKDAVFSPDGKYIVTVSKDNTTKIWDAYSGNILAHHIYESDVHSVSFSPNGKHIVTTIRDTVRVCEAQNDKTIATFFKNDNSAYFSNAAFSPSGDYIVITDRTAVYIWNIYNGVIRTIKHDDDINFATFTSCSRFVITASDDGTVIVWNVSHGDRVTEPLKHKVPVIYANFAADKKSIVTISKDSKVRIWTCNNHLRSTKDLIRTSKRIAYYDKYISIYDPLFIDQDVKVTHNKHIRHASFSYDKMKLVTASEDSTAIVWDACNGMQLVGPLKHDGYVTYAEFSYNGKYVGTASCDYSARVWNAQNGTPITKSLKHKGIVRTIDFSPNSQYVITASDDRTAKIWNFQSDIPTADLKHKAPVEFAYYSPSGKHIVTSSDSTVYIWDTNNLKKEPIKFKHNHFSIDVLKFTQNEKYLITISDDAIYVWDRNTEELVNNPIINLGHIYHFSLNQDGKYFAVSSGKTFKNTKITIFEVSTCVPILEYDTTNSNQSIVFFSPDSKKICIRCSHRGRYYATDVQRDIPFPPLQELIDNYNNDINSDWSLSKQEKEIYELE